MEASKEEEAPKKEEESKPAASGQKYDGGAIPKVASEKKK
jgi:hypothetical protein